MRNCLSIVVGLAIVCLAGGCDLAQNETQAGESPRIDGVEIFPADNPWNQDISSLPVRGDSDAIIAAYGTETIIAINISSRLSSGIPYVVVDSNQPDVPITFTMYGDESDPGPYPIADDAAIEGGADSTGDRHVLVLDRARRRLYEMYKAYKNAGAGWSCRSGAVWDLTENNKRLSGYTWTSPAEKGPLIDWTSADAAGLPIFPGLVKYTEVASGEVRHAFRMGIPVSSPGYVYPASHHSPSHPAAGYAVMGMRFRLKADFDESGYPEEIRTILRAMKTYGMIVADNAWNWHICAAPDSRWADVDRSMLDGGELAIRGRHLEIVDTGAIRQPHDAPR